MRSRLGRKGFGTHTYRSYDARLHHYGGMRGLVGGNYRSFELLHQRRNIRRYRKVRTRT